jgi:hypothetical protein
MLVEIAIGDAYGAGFEYVKDYSIIENYNNLSGYIKHPIHNLQPGSYTDDTQMSIAIAELIINENVWTPEIIAKYFLEAFHRDVRDVYARRFQEFLSKTKTAKDFLKNIGRDCFTSEYLEHHKHKIDWEPFKRGDYRVAKKLYGKIPKKIYINKPLTKLQRQVEDGFGRRDDKFTVEEIITDFKEIDNNQFKSGKIKSSLEVTKKELNYDKINQIFAGQKHNPTVINRPTTISQPQPKTNSEMIQKLMGKKRNR